MSISKRDAELLRRVEARIRRLRPDLAAALLRSLDAIRDLLTDAEIRDLLSGRTTVEALFTDAALVTAMAPFRRAITSGVQGAVRLTVPDLPVPRRVTPPTLDVLFDVLNPNVIRAIREVESPAIKALSEQIRGTVEAYTENALRNGAAPREAARQLRSVIGLAPNQLAYTANMERELRSLDPKVLQRVLRDRRFDSTIRKAIASGKPLTEKQITDTVNAYVRKFTAHQANQVTATITRDAYKAGQRLAHAQSVELGFVDGDDLIRTWVHFDAQPDPRPEHVALAGETVRWDQPYSTGQMTAGDGEINCKCSDRYGVRRGTRVPAATAARTVRAAAIAAF